jgi:hypothetical protein
LRPVRQFNKILRKKAGVANVLRRQCLPRVRNVQIAKKQHGTIRRKASACMMNNTVTCCKAIL